MTWGAPLLAAIAAGIAIPALLILYFLKLRRKTVEISTTLLWKQAIQDLQANAPFQKLRKNILLLLQLLILAAALFAIAQPRSDTQTAQGERYVLLIDRSASMASVDPETGKTRLELAKEQVLEQIEALRSAGPLSGDERSDQAMVVAFDATGEIIERFTSDKARLREAVRAIRQTDAPSSIEEGFKLAQAQRPKRVLLDNVGEETEELTVEGLVGGPSLIFHLYSDGRVPDLASVVLREDKDKSGDYSKEADTFKYFPVGSPQAVNIGVTSLRAERDYESPERVSLFVGVQSNDPRARSVDVELEIDGQAVQAIRTVEIEGVVRPEGTPESEPLRPTSSGVVFKLEEPSGFLARVRLSVPDSASADGLAIDNESVLVVPPGRQTTVAVVGPGNVYLTEAVGGMPLARLTTWTPSQYDAARALGEAEQYDVIVLDRTLPPTDETGAVLPGRYLVLGAVPPPPFGVIDGGETGAPEILDWNRTHPVLRDITLDSVRIANGRSVQVPDGSGAVSLMETNAGAGILELSMGGARAVVVPWDVGQSNWPFQVGFVVFLAASVDYLSTDAVSAAELGGASRQFRPGEVLRARLPTDATNAVVVLPSGEEQPVVPGVDGTVLYGPLRFGGVYRVRWTGTPGPTDLVDGSRVSRFYAANLLDPEESDTATLPQIDLGSRDRSSVQVADRAARRTREYWPWLIIGALVVMMLEWWVFNRKVHV